MPKLTQRLARLEKATCAIGGGIACRLCHDSPVAVVRVMHEKDPHGPGLRKTGECYLLAKDDGERLTDDLRCRECGAEAIPSAPVGHRRHPPGANGEAGVSGLTMSEVVSP